MRNLLKIRKQYLVLESHATRLEQQLEITERSHREALRDSSERLAQVIDIVPAMISAADCNGRFVNGFQAALAGIDPKEAVGQEISALFRPDHSCQSRALDRKVFKTGTALPPYEEEFVDCGGSRRVLLTTKSPLHGRGHSIMGVLTSSVEITERKRAEDHNRAL